MKIFNKYIFMLVVFCMLFPAILLAYMSILYLMIPAVYGFIGGAIAGLCTTVIAACDIHKLELRGDNI